MPSDLHGAVMYTSRRAAHAHSCTYVSCLSMCVRACVRACVQGLLDGRGSGGAADPDPAVVESLMSRLEEMEATALAAGTPDAAKR